MRCLDRARSIVRGIYGISQPDPDRIDIGAVADTVALLEAIDAAMPRIAVMELIRPHNATLVAFLAGDPTVTRRNAGLVTPVSNSHSSVP